ncbi:uncharacterized protein BDZ99DRAFT_520639 [Mytilinidion resinicola]|uniref:Uncharacterized protein n=1 Tax=Mytilinidion resinicola TaxID=574789 RepID=A0A6A6YKF2_9PEZI|nr:uncharacterized protein BDZ99DRAFT_520639 [Mytilinidion resinicola]KAF2809270.1 hypothetical protein BDZ99DRAFT_520639 [Mytilinidion resinicola]
MGLPVWRAPSPEDSKDAIKVDLTASSRSTIRRRGQRSPVVPRRARRSANPHAAPATAPYTRSPRRGEFGFRIAPDFDLNSLGQSSSARRDRDLAPLPPVPESRNYTRDARERAEGNRARNARDYHGYHDHSNHYFGLSEERDSLPSPYRQRDGLPAYTPNFAPAAYNPSHSFTALPPLRPSRTPPTRAESRSRHELVVIDSDEEGSEGSPVGFPPLRRMGRRTIADGPLPSSSLRESWSPASTVDGLGDRERSFSPADNHWDTMLITVAPDPHLPSADSSFTSAATSASFSHPSSRSASSNSNSNSASSSRTHLTVPSTHSPEQVLTGVCESSDEDSGASDTEASESSVAPAHLSSTAPARNPSRYSRHVRDRSNEAVRFVRNFYSFTSSRAGPHPHNPYHHHRHHDSLAFQGSSSLSPPPLLPPVVDGPILDDTDSALRGPVLEPNLDQLRAILRELIDSPDPDVPEELWVSADLSLERLERQRERLIREMSQRERERL